MSKSSQITTKFGAYSVAKLAVFRLWDFLGAWHPNLSIFHTQPGVVDTDMSKESGGVDAVGFQDDGKLCLNSSTEVNIIADHIIVSLPGNFNVWLASPEARFLKGKFLWSNWDVDELKAQEKDVVPTYQEEGGLCGFFHYAEKPGYSGVGLYARKQPDRVRLA